MSKEFLNSCKKRSKILKMEFFVSFIHRRRLKKHYNIDFSLSSTVFHSLEIFPIAVHLELSRKFRVQMRLGLTTINHFHQLDNKNRIKSCRKRFNDD